MIDVSPHNALLDQYLGTQDGDDNYGYGIRTQIRLEYLKADGFHVRPQFDSIIDKTYACAIVAVDVPCPTPWGEFVPNHIRRRWEKEWPQPGGRRTEGLTRENGWRR